MNSLLLCRWAHRIVRHLAQNVEVNGHVPCLDACEVHISVHRLWTPIVLSSAQSF